MRLPLLPLLAVLFLFNLPLDAQSPQIRTIDFEGFSDGFVLSNQITGVLFTYVSVATPSIINGGGIDLSAASSGISTGNTIGGARVEFSDPVIQVSCTVSPPWISVNTRRVTSYLNVVLTAYDSAGNMTGRSTTPVIGSIAEPEQIYNYAPSTISVSSSTPIQSVTLDYDAPFGDGIGDGGARLLFDDLTFIVKEQLPLAAPVLRIERLSGTRFWISSDITSTMIQQSTDLDGLPSQPAILPWSFAIDTSTNSAMFFRGVRPTD